MGRDAFLPTWLLLPASSRGFAFEQMQTSLVRMQFRGLGFRVYGLGFHTSIEKTVFKSLDTNSPEISFSIAWILRMLVGSGLAYSNPTYPLNPKV